METVADGHRVSFRASSRCFRESAEAEDADRERQSLAANRHITAEIAGRLASMGPAVTRILARNGSLPGHIGCCWIILTSRPPWRRCIPTARSQLPTGLPPMDPARRRSGWLPAGTRRSCAAQRACQRPLDAGAAGRGQIPCRRVRYHGGSRIRQGLECLSRDSEASIRAMVASDHRHVGRHHLPTGCRSESELRGGHRAPSRQAPGDLGLLDEPSEHVRFRAAKTLLRGWGRTPKQLARLSEKVAADPSTRLRWVAAGSGVCPERRSGC